MNGKQRTALVAMRLPILLLLFCSKSYPQDTVSISDFRYPETRAIDWKGGMNGSFQQKNTESSPIPPNSLSARIIPGSTDTYNTSQGTYNAHTTFLFFHSKENHDQTFQLTASGFLSPYREDEVRVDTTRREEDQTRTTWNAGISENWLYLHYLTDEGLHFLGSIVTNYRASGSEFRDVFTPPRVYGNSQYLARSYSVSFRGSLGIGYGRLRDGTFVFRTLRIVERLREDGLLARPLSRAEMLGLVDRIARQREYTTNHERPDKYFVRDVVDELTSMGVLAPGAVTPYSALRIWEGYQESLTQRMFGWRVYYAFNDSHDQSKDETYYSSSNTEDYEDGWAHIHEFGFEFGHPLSLYTHLSGQCIVDIPLHDHETRSTVTAGATLSHQVGERLEIDGTYDFLFGLRYTPIVGESFYTRSTVHTVQGNFVYFVEDRLRFQSSVGYLIVHDHAYGYNVFYTPETTSSSGITLSFGLTYNII